jgi:4-amino-4-deoxy-L-arabinose transferase-like glycosyltransferase
MPYNSGFNNATNSTKDYFRLNILILIAIVGIYLIVISPFLWPDGMFLDGVTYATISKNMSNNIGTFCTPHYTDVLYPTFHEHPPLAIAIESLFFRLLGDSIYTERIYSLLTLLCTCLIIILIWQQTGNKLITGWIPLLFYFSMPLILWVFCNNMLENTLCIFIGLSIFFYLESTKKNRFIYLSLSGIMIVAGILTKGPFALFPLFFPLLYWFFKRTTSLKYLINNMLIIILIILGSFFYLLVFNTETSESLTLYFNRQIIESLRNTIEGNRFFIFGRMALEILPSLIILFVLMVLHILKYGRTGIFNHNGKQAYLFLIFGLTGVIPIIVSLKQRGFYIAPPLMFFALGFASLIENKFIHYLQKITLKLKQIKIITVVVIFIVIVSVLMPFSQLNNINRNKKIISDLRILHSVLPENSTINISPKLYDNWSLHAYFARYYNISLDPDIKKQKFYLLIDPSLKNDIKMEGYYKVDVALSTFELYSLLKKTNSK